MGTKKGRELDLKFRQRFFNTFVFRGLAYFEGIKLRWVGLIWTVREVKNLICPVSKESEDVYSKCLGRYHRHHHGGNGRRDRS